MGLSRRLAVRSPDARRSAAAGYGAPGGELSISDALARISERAARTRARGRRRGEKRGAAAPGVIRLGWRGAARGARTGCGLRRRETLARGVVRGPGLFAGA